MSTDNRERLTPAEHKVDELIEQYDLGPAMPHRYHPARVRQALMAAYSAGQEATQAEIGESVTRLETEATERETTIARLQSECDNLARTNAQQASMLQELEAEVPTTDSLVARSPAKPYPGWD